MRDLVPFIAFVAYFAAIFVASAMYSCRRAQKRIGNLKPGTMLHFVTSSFKKESPKKEHWIRQFGYESPEAEILVKHHHLAGLIALVVGAIPIGVARYFQFI